MPSDFDTLLEAGTAVIADVFDSFGRVPPVLDTSLFHLGRDFKGFAGPAYTVSGESVRWSGGDRTKLAAIDAMQPGVVAVWAGNDVKGVCCFGDLLGTAMQARGCTGIVVDGGIRDSAFLETLKVPIVARYRTPAQAIGRWRVSAAQVTVRLRGALEDWVTISPGDIVVADNDGVIVIPIGMLSNISLRVAEWSATESQSRGDIQNGMPLLTAIEKYGHL